MMTEERQSERGAETGQTPLISGLSEAAIILARPRYPENVGAAARVACNFGIGRLIIVKETALDKERMLKMATHKAAHLIENAFQCEEMAEAAAPFHFIIGTTAREGKQRLPEQAPRHIMKEVAPLAVENRVALMFGPENTGLTNCELDFCHYASTVTTADFSSLNLAQAVAIHCYELHEAISALDPAALPNREEPPYAESRELEAMYAHLSEVLERVTFLRGGKQAYWLRNIRRFLNRVQLRKKEAAIIRGICRKFLWYDDRKQFEGGKSQP